MLERHAAASASVRSAERALLSEQLAALEAALKPGLTRLNWTSLTIPEFVAAVNKVGGCPTVPCSHATISLGQLAVDQDECLLSTPHCRLAGQAAGGSMRCL